MAYRLQDLTLAVCDVAKRAGQYICNERKGFSTECVERKHAHDYVSYVDKSSERLIVSALRQLLPEAGFITEEGTATRQEQQLLWVVDPLDGTTNFIHGYAPYCVSIALLRAGQVQLGVVYEVTTGECYHAWLGGGAHLTTADGATTALHVSRQPIEDALLCIQLPYNSEAYRHVALHLIGHFYGRAASVRMSGSAAMSLCYVAAGRLDGYMEKYIGQWDYMAGAILVAEAGGRVTDYEGSTDFTSGNSVVASNAVVHDALLEAIASHAAIH